MPKTSSTPATSAAKATPGISRTMRVNDILTLLPNAESLLAQYGLSCFNCSMNTLESLEDGCKSHGMKDAVIDDLMKDLNELFAVRPERPQTLTLTEPAALALLEIMKSQNKDGWGLAVGLDEVGGFSMEFAEKPNADDQIFSHDAVHDVRLFASPLTLASIGGSTIDFRDGRFKLDLPGSKNGCGCKGGGECACGGECGCK